MRKEDHKKELTKQVNKAFSALLKSGAVHPIS